MLALHLGNLGSCSASNQDGKLNLADLPHKQTYCWAGFTDTQLSPAADSLQQTNSLNCWMQRHQCHCRSTVVVHRLLKQLRSRDRV